MSTHTDPNEIDPEPSGNRPKGHEVFTVYDHSNDNAKFYDARPAAEDRVEAASGIDGVDVALYPPGESPEEMYHGDTQTDDTAETEVVEDAPDTNHEPEVMSPDEIQQASDQLPEDRHVDEDPLKWLPGEFVDTIDGSNAINRKGFEVLAHFYDVDVEAELEVTPEETDHEYARVKATATIGDRVVEAYGSAHVDRGDDHYLLLEMADTRARKRALSIATGAGAVAVDELINDPEGQR